MVAPVRASAYRPLRGVGPGAFVRWYRPLMLGLAIAVLAVGLALSLAHLGAYTSRGLVGVDYRLFAELGRRWTADGSMYAAWQFAPYRFDQGSGTNDVASMPGLYPPPAGPLFAIVGAMPPILWWIVPLAVLGVVLVRWRPAPWSWPLLAAVTLSPNLTGVLATGGSTMWVAAGVAAGLVYGWPALVILIKPTFAPFLLVGARRRSFWLAGVVLSVVSLAMLPEWARWIEVLRNTESPGLLYSLYDLPLMALPLVAWLARRQPLRRGDWNATLNRPDRSTGIVVVATIAPVTRPEFRPRFAATPPIRRISIAGLALLAIAIIIWIAAMI